MIYLKQHPFQRLSYSHPLNQTVTIGSQYGKQRGTSLLSMPLNSTFFSFFAVDLGTFRKLPVLCAAPVSHVKGTNHRLGNRRN